MRGVAGLCLGGLLALASLTACWGVDEAAKYIDAAPDSTCTELVDLTSAAHEDEYLSPEELDRVLDALAAEEAERCPLE